jgi:hypothetical protein
MASEDERHPLDRLEEIAIPLAVRQTYDEQNRLALLMIHGLGGLATTFLMFRDHLSVTQQVLMGEWAMPFNVLPGLGGAILLLGLAWGRRLLLEGVGMAILLAWDFGMVRMFVEASQRFPHDHDPRTVSTLYPLSIYGQLGMLLAVHAWTLVRLVARERAA